MGYVVPTRIIIYIIRDSVRQCECLDGTVHCNFCASPLLLRSFIFITHAFYIRACHSLFMLAEGVWAEVKVGSEHIHLFAEHNAQGVQFSVYNVNTKSWIAPSEFVRDIQEGKDRAAALAEAYLHRTLNVELPALEWKKARSV